LSTCVEHTQCPKCAEKKDSWTLLKILSDRRSFVPIDYDIVPVHVNMGFDCTHVDLAKAAGCFCDVCREKWTAYSQKHLSRAVPIEEACASDDPLAR